MSSIAVVGYITLFFTVGALFLLVNLLVGKLVRPKDPHAEKLEIYECGEPTIGSSFVQFDLRFYVVALLFLIFDVEVAFFFPWATVYGKANHLRSERLLEDDAVREEAVAGLFQELGVGGSASLSADEIRESATGLATLAVFDILIFFAVILVGFAYVWMRGDLDWVRAVSLERKSATSRGPPPAPKPAEEEPVLA